MSTVSKTGGGVAVHLRPDEAALLQTLLEQLLELVGEAPGPGDELAALGIATSAEKPDDPVLARLFPDGYRDDGEAAGEFRRYTEIGLRDGKREAALAVLSAVAIDDDVPDHDDESVQTVLDDKQFQLWLRALNDLRLALGTRLDVSEDWYDEAARLDPSDPRVPMFVAYDWLSMLQDNMVEAIGA